MQQQDIREIEFSVLKDHVIRCGEKPFRAKQVWEWVWQKGATSFEEMSNLSKSLRTLLERDFYFSGIHIEEESVAADGTRKICFRFDDNSFIEGVLIPSGDRVTACISTQVGCPLACTFCATAAIKHKRDLRSGEIFAQVYFLHQQSLHHYGRGLSNIVVMGMGEPLLVYDSLMRALHYVSSEEGLGISPRRITISTAGIIKGIKRFTKDHPRYNLAVSLHSADDQKRSTLMPINKSNPLSDLRSALAEYAKVTGERVGIEYLLLAGINDSVNDAEELAKFCRAFPVKVNIILYNSVPSLPYAPSSELLVKNFVSVLEGKNMLVQIRRSRGHDIAAACGQLAGKRS